MIHSVSRIVEPLRSVVVDHGVAVHDVVVHDVAVHDVVLHDDGGDVGVGKLGHGRELGFLCGLGISLLCEQYEVCQLEP